MVLFFVKALCVLAGIVLACAAMLVGALALSIAWNIRTLLVLAAMLAEALGLRRGLA